MCGRKSWQQNAYFCLFNMYMFCGSHISDDFPLVACYWSFFTHNSFFHEVNSGPFDVYSFNVFFRSMFSGSQRLFLTATKPKPFSISLGIYLVGVRIVVFVLTSLVEFSSLSLSTVFKGLFFQLLPPFLATGVGNNKHQWDFSQSITGANTEPSKPGKVLLGLRLFVLAARLSVKSVSQSLQWIHPCFVVDSKMLESPTSSLSFLPTEISPPRLSPSLVAVLGLFYW